MHVENPFGKILPDMILLAGSSGASPSISGYEKEERHPPLTEGHRSNRPVRLPRTQKIAGTPDMKYSTLLCRYLYLFIVF